MLLRRLVVVGLVGIVSFAFNVATAQDAGGPTIAAVDNVSFSDPAGERSFAEGGAFALSISQAPGLRFAQFAPASASDGDNGDHTRGYEVALTRSRVGGLVDVSIAQRGALSVDENGDISGRSSGSELRLGRLGGLRRGEPTGTPTWYLFAASDDEALTWRPGSSGRRIGATGGSFAVRDRVEIGDLQAGITYERGRMQASLAYVEREISVRTAGSHSISSDESFAGFTFTMRN